LASSPFGQGMASHNSRCFFVFDDGLHGYELWSSDGTDAGTAMVADLVPGPNSAFQKSSSPLFTSWNGSLFFVADDGVTSSSLWKTDGTSAGTELVYSVPVQRTSTERLVPFGDNLFFISSGIWRTNGTEEGTTVAVPAASLVSMSHLTAVGSRLFFVGTSVVEGVEPWVSDGTPEATRILKDIYPNATSQNGVPFGSYPHELVGLGDTLYFATSYGQPSGLWKSDGTEMGTVLICEGSCNNVTTYNGALYFNACQAPIENVLFRSDGTAAGTGVFGEFAIDERAHVNSIESFGTGALFTATDDVAGAELWFTNGTAADTARVADVAPGISGSFPWNIASLGASAVFRVTDLWSNDLAVTNGNASGTHVFHTFPSLAYSRDLTVLNGKAYLRAATAEGDIALWETDGTSAGTTVVVSLGTYMGVNQGPNSIRAVNGMLFFTHWKDPDNEELWTSDGTAAGTQMIRSFVPFYNFVAPNLAGTGNGYYFFAANDGVHGVELWRSDGTLAGTTLVSDINPGSDSSQPCSFSCSGDIVLFSADDGVHGRELWRSDGTPAGTFLVQDIHTGPGSSSPDWITPTPGGRFVLNAFDPQHGHEMWVSDGSAGSAWLLQDLAPGLVGSNPSDFTCVGSQLLFAAQECCGARGRDLWSMPSASIQIAAVDAWELY
jgi:ELWxxDGT repeat protein